MAEGTRDRERQAVISNLFPLQEQSVLDAFNKLSFKTNPDGAQTEIEQEMNIFSETNPYAVTYFVQMLKEFPSKEKADQIFWGILVCHQALREQAKLTGGILPTFTKEFVQDYATKREEKFKSIGIDKNITIEEAIIQSSRQDLVKFENMEPGFSNIVGREKGKKAGWGPEQDLRYSGIINLYWLFKQGCSDPKNFQQSP